MDSFLTYDKHTELTNEWVHRLPSHWSYSSLRWLARIFSGGTPSKTIEEYWENGTVPWLNSGAVNQKYIISPSTYITNDALANSSAKWIAINSLVVALAGQGKTKGMVAQVGIETTCNQSMAAIVPENATDSRYLYWWLESNYQNIRNMAGGDLRDGLNLELLGGIMCPIPLEDEKSAIANFLDHETAKIDTLIEKQQQLIKLLKEKRQAVISHAVTNGLNPDAPMRDSGVEWLGEVPVGWDDSSLKHLIMHTVDNRGRTPPIVSEGIPMCEVKQVAGSGFSTSANFDKYVTRDSYDQFVRSEVREDDVLFVTVGATFGKVCLVPPSPDFFIAQNIVGFRVTKFVYSKYLMFLLGSTVFKSAISGSNKSSTIDNVKVSDLVRTKIVLPAIDEQIQIAEYLFVQFELFDKIMTKCESQISLLTERRRALISAAVTGKIDVRNWQTSTSKKAQPNKEATP